MTVHLKLPKLLPFKATFSENLKENIDNQNIQIWEAQKEKLLAYYKSFKYDRSDTRPRPWEAPHQEHIHHNTGPGYQAYIKWKNNQYPKFGRWNFQPQNNASYGYHSYKANPKHPQSHQYDRQMWTQMHKHM